MKETNSIIQIIPAEGWFAVYSQEKSKGVNEGESYEPLIAWALIKTIFKNGESIYGVEGFIVLQSDIDLANEASNFVRYECRPEKSFFEKTK